MASSCSMANYYTRHQEDISSNTVSMPEGFSDHIKEMPTMITGDFNCHIGDHRLPRGESTRTRRLSKRPGLQGHGLTLP